MIVDGSGNVKVSEGEQWVKNIFVLFVGKIKVFLVNFIN